MNILYLSPLIPAPSGSGGKRAIYNHLMDLKQIGFGGCQLLCIDVEEQGLEVPADLDGIGRICVLPRAFPKFASCSTLSSVSVALVQLLTDTRPRALAAVGSESASAWIRQVLAEEDFDCVVVDHYSAFGLINEVDVDIPLVYIAHNFEAAILRDRIGSDSHPIRKLFSFSEYLKARRHERLGIARSAATIFIAGPDRAAMRHLLDGKRTVVWPELSAPKQARWAAGGGKNLLFVGAPHYFPNRDAIRWLVQELMPLLAALDPAIGLDIVGARRDEVDVEAADNVRFLGFVSDAELETRYLGAALFISPVVLGNGIKIKVLEAASYGTPVACTAESMAGLEFLKDAMLEFRRDQPEAVASGIHKVLGRPDALTGMSTSVAASYQAAFESRPRLLEVLKDLLQSQTAGGA